VGYENSFIFAFERILIGVCARAHYRARRQAHLQTSKGPSYGQIYSSATRTATDLHLKRWNVHHYGLLETWG
jgi:hypothetical protein